MAMFHPFSMVFHGHGRWFLGVPRASCHAIAIAESPNLEAWTRSRRWNGLQLCASEAPQSWDKVGEHYSGVGKCPILGILDITSSLPRLFDGQLPNIWLCLKIGYTSNYSHLVGIMIINHWVLVQWGTLFSDKAI